MDIEEYLRKLSEKLRSIRKSKGISQKSIADHLNITAGAYLRIEKGLTELKFYTFLKACEFMEVDYKEVLQIEPQDEPTHLLKEIDYLKQITELQDEQIELMSQSIEFLKQSKKDQSGVGKS